MSGDNQHYIPQHVLKGFKAQIPEREKKIWVYRDGHAPSLEPIKCVASETHFYSKPSSDGDKTLDDLITRYEARLAALIRWLRKQQQGPVANPELAAEIIAHLTVRTDSARENLSSFGKQALLMLSNFFGEANSLRQFMRLDLDTPNESFRKHIDAVVRERPELYPYLIHRPVFEKIFFDYVRQNFDEFHQENRAVFSASFARMYEQVDTLARQGLMKALGQGLVPEKRLEFLKDLRWVIVHCSPDVVLPDCVAIASTKDGAFGPLFVTDLDHVRHVVVPLTTHRLLIGEEKGTEPYDPVFFNLQAVACSERFFMCATNIDQLSQWTRYIGVKSFSVVNKVVREAFDELRTKRLAETDEDKENSVG